jgi:hypothetical protein
LRGSALSSVAVPMFGAQERSGQSAAAAHEGEPRIAHPARPGSLPRLRGGSCGRRPLEMVGRSIMCLASLVRWGALLLAPIRCDAQTTPPTARPQAVVIYQAVNSVGWIDVAVTQYFCSLAAQF